MFHGVIKKIKVSGFRMQNKNTFRPPNPDSGTYSASPNYKLLLSQLLFVVITYEYVSLWLWKNLENSGHFSPTLLPP